MRRFQGLRYMMEYPKQLSFIDFSDRFLNADAEYILNYTSNVVKIKNDGKNYFFKEAKRHKATVRECIYDGIDCFFEDIVRNEDLKARVLCSLQESGIRLLINMGGKIRSGDPFNRYLVSGDEGCIGLPSPNTQEEKKQLKMLAFYLYGEIQNWFYNISVRADELETFSAARALAVKELAKLLGTDDLIVKCDYVKIKLFGKEKYGIISEEAIGDSLISLPPRQRARNITVHLLRSLTRLNLMDAISRDNDHRIGNYTVVTDESGRYLSVLSFDNDSPDAFGLSANLTLANLIGCSGFIDKQGYVNRAHLDKTMAETVMNMEKADLAPLKPYLNDIQLYFLWKRITKLKRAIDKTAKKRNDFLVDPDGWSTEHMKRDLSQKYKKTYLASLMLDCYYETGFHNFDTL